MKTVKPTVLIYIEDVHPGISYSLDVMSRISGWNILWIDELPAYGEEDIILSYTKDTVEGLPLMERSGFWENMTAYPLESVNNGSLMGLFPVFKGIMSIDLPAFVFWAVSRIEEYRAFKSDKYGRFKASDSWAFKNHMLSRPFIDEWVHLWQLKMISVFPELEIPEKKIQNRPSFDVDYPYLFKYHKLQKKLRVLGGAFIKGKWSLFVQFLKGQDPFDTFEFILDSLEEHGRTGYFFLLANNRKFKEDNTLPLENRQYQDLIEKLNAKGILGIHPSLLSHNIPGQLQKEIQRLENIINRKVLRSRSHYLKVQMPDTYRNLINAGLEHDHTMGFADHPGFRAGTAYPFYWYDLEKNRPTNLKVHPLIFMDVTFRLYLNATPDECLEIIERICQKMLTTGGEFSWLWHNSSFEKANGWKKWTKVYQKLLDF